MKKKDENVSFVSLFITYGLANDISMGAGTCTGHSPKCQIWLCGSHTSHNCFEETHAGLRTMREKLTQS